MLGGAFMEYVVNFTFDDEASVWIATSEDVPGLVLEDESFDLLSKKVMEAVPELIEVNHLPKGKTIRLSSPSVWNCLNFRGSFFLIFSASSEK